MELGSVMFFAITFLVGFLLTTFFAPKPKIENAKAASLSDFNFPRADEGDPVPRWYGTCKFQGLNTIFAGDFQAVPIKKKVKTGLFSSKKQIIGYRYFVGLDLAICLGPKFVFKRLWAGKYELWNGCLFGEGCVNVIPINRPELFGGKDKNGGWSGDVAMYCGQYDQPQDSYLVSKLGADVPAYVGVAHMVMRKCYVGNSASIEPIYVEGSLFSNSLGSSYNVMPNGLDINPVEVLCDLYMNDWGNLNINPAKINLASWRIAAKKIFDEGNGMSIVVANANTGSDVTKQILKQINGTIFENPSTGLFELVLIRKDYDIDTLPVIGPNEISSITNFTKKLWSETNNKLRVKFTDRSQGYKTDTIAQAYDFANIRFQKRINATEISFPTVYVGALANELAARELANLNVPLYQCELSMDRTEIGLLPGSVFVLNWPEYNIVRMVMRVRKFGLGTLESGKLTFGVVQDEFASDAVVTGTPTTGNPEAPDYTAKPIAAFPFELPYWLKVVSGFKLEAGSMHFAFLAPKPGPYSLGYNAIDTSIADEEDAEVLSMESYTVTAKLTEPFAKFAGFVSGIAEEMVIGEVSDTSVLGTFNDALLKSGRGLFYLNMELMSYSEAEDNGDGTWTLTGIHRSMVDTGWQGGAIGDILFFIADQVGFLPDDGPFEGKLQDVTGAGPFPLAEADIVALNGTGRADRPYPPDAVTLDGQRAANSLVGADDIVTLAWSERNRLTNPGVLKFEDEATEAPEADTVYIVKVENEIGVEVFVSDEIAVPTFDLTITDEMQGLSTVLVWAKVGPLLSYAAAPYPVIVGDFVTVDGEFLTVDGEKVTVE
jgi:hypothetical protein